MEDRRIRRMKLQVSGPPQNPGTSQKKGVVSEQHRRRHSEVFDGFDDCGPAERRKGSAPSSVFEGSHLEMDVR